MAVKKTTKKIVRDHYYMADGDEFYAPDLTGFATAKKEAQARANDLNEPIFVIKVVGYCIPNRKADANAALKNFELFTKE